MVRAAVKHSCFRGILLLKEYFVRAASLSLKKGVQKTVCLFSKRGGRKSACLFRKKLSHQISMPGVYRKIA